MSPTGGVQGRPRRSGHRPFTPNARAVPRYTQSPGPGRSAPEGAPAVRRYGVAVEAIRSGWWRWPCRRPRTWSAGRTRCPRPSCDGRHGDQPGAGRAERGGRWRWHHHRVQPGRVGAGLGRRPRAPGEPSLTSSRPMSRIGQAGLLRRLEGGPDRRGKDMITRCIAGRRRGVHPGQQGQARALARPCPGRRRLSRGPVADLRGVAHVDDATLLRPGLTPAQLSSCHPGATLVGGENQPSGRLNRGRFAGPAGPRRSRRPAWRRGAGGARRAGRRTGPSFWPSSAAPMPWLKVAP